MISLKELGWLAGIMEGEGHFGLRRGAKDLCVEVTMTDKDVVDRFHSILGFGTRKERILPSGKVAYKWQVTNQGQAAGLVMTLLPLMGLRRAERIRHCIRQWKSKPLPKRQWTHCKSGHELIGENLRVTTEGKYHKRRCLECGKLRERKYRAKLAA
jgi:hypothetical protein